MKREHPQGPPIRCGMCLAKGRASVFLGVSDGGTRRLALPAGWGFHGRGYFAICPDCRPKGKRA